MHDQTSRKGLHAAPLLGGRAGAWLLRLRPRKAPLRLRIVRPVLQALTKSPQPQAAGQQDGTLPGAPLAGYTLRKGRPMAKLGGILMVPLGGTKVQGATKALVARQQKCSCSAPCPSVLEE